MKTHSFYKAIAHRLKHEWIIDLDGDVCLRPMLFNDDGTRIVRYAPDPCDFKPIAEAVSALADCSDKEVRRELGFPPRRLQP